MIWQPRSNGRDPIGKVVVVGAGLAGLAAALDLLVRGAAVTVLEARDRVGGRVWSVQVEGGDVAELGGEWIEPEYRALPALAERLGVELVLAGIDYRRRAAVGSEGATLEQQEAFLKVARERRAAMPPDEARALTLGEYIRSLPGTEAQRRTLRARLQGTFAQDLDRVALSYCEASGTFGEHPANYRRAAGGNQSIAVAVAERLPDLRLGHVVERIRIRGDGGTVEGQGPAGPFREEAAGVIVSLPAPVAASLRFEPSLPDDVGVALGGLPMGVASKLVVATAEDPALRAVQNLDVPCWCYVACGAGGRSRRVLTSFAGSPQAQERLGTASGDPSTWLALLGEMNPDLTFSGDAVMHAWAADPSARGAYSAFDQPSLDRAPALQRPVGRLILAGEHTAGEWSGTMEGAVRSGQRAAAQMAGILGTAPGIAESID